MENGGAEGASAKQLVGFGFFDFLEPPYQCAHGILPEIVEGKRDRTQFEGAEKELRRVGGEEEVVACYKQAAEREAKVIEKVTNGRMKVAGDRIVVNQATRRSRSRSRSRSGSRAKK
ncbi:unnamed protein product [Durusdinium trenchii]|uniref:Uncharacterized protein n=1 Tax=Durusdinium trenchii TaxID=1381693 RepID=A0ABP0PGA8_9DINO